MVRNSDAVIYEINKAADIREYIKQNEAHFSHETVRDFLNRVIEGKCIRVSDIGERSGQKEYIYKIFNGTRKASRNVLLSLAIGMELSLELTREMLSAAEYALLNPARRRDTIIIYCLLKHISYPETQALLKELGEELL